MTDTPKFIRWRNNIFNVNEISAVYTQAEGSRFYIKIMFANKEPLRWWYSSSEKRDDRLSEIADLLVPPSPMLKLVEGAGEEDDVSQTEIERFKEAAEEAKRQSEEIQYKLDLLEEKFEAFRGMVVYG